MTIHRNHNLLRSFERVSPRQLDRLTHSPSRGCFPHAQTSHRRRSVGADRAAPARAQAAAQALSRAQEARRPQSDDRDCVRAAFRHSLANAAAGNGVRLRDDVLEPSVRVAGSGRVGEDPSRAPAEAPWGRSDRLVAGARGFRFAARGGGGGKKAAPIRPTGARPGANITSSRTRGDCPWPFVSRAPTSMTSRNFCRWLMRSRRCEASAVGGRAADPSEFRATARTTPPGTAARCAPGASSRSWPGATRPTAAGWAPVAGRWNERLRGCVNSSDSACGMIAEPIFTRDFYRSRAL